MNIRPCICMLLFAATLVRGAEPAKHDGFDHTHALLTRLLTRVVGGERVDYAGLKKDPTSLRSYLDLLAAVPRAEFDGWSKPDRLAFLINLYNASTLQLIVDHYPVKSIKKIGSLLQGPWQKQVVRLWGRMESLDHVEHELIRAHYQEPRAHFALVCASIGCPPLRPEAYAGAKLDGQLADQGRRFLSSPSKNRFDAATGVLFLSPVFNWFAKDFAVPGGDIRSFVAPYFPAEQQPAILKPGVRVKFTDYDWLLNSLQDRSP